MKSPQTTPPPVRQVKTPDTVVSDFKHPVGGENNLSMTASCGVQNTKCGHPQIEQGAVDEKLHFETASSIKDAVQTPLPQGGRPVNTPDTEVPHFKLPPDEGNNLSMTTSHDDPKASLDHQCSEDIARELFIPDEVPRLATGICTSKKYGLKKWKYWRDDSDKNSKALLKWRTVDSALRTSEEFAELLSSRLGRSNAENGIKGNDSSITTSALCNFLALKHDLETEASFSLMLFDLSEKTNCCFLIPDTCKNLFVEGVSHIFHPSCGRSDIFDRRNRIYNAFKKDREKHADFDKFTRIIAVEPNEVEMYAKKHLHKNCVILVLPLNKQGAGYVRNIIQCVANKFAWSWIWMVDDSCQCSFFDYGTQKGCPKVSMPMPQFLREMESRVFTDLCEKEDLDTIATVGSVKFRGGRGANNEFMEGYASSMFLLHVKATCRHNVMFNAEHACAEDICFYVACTAKGLRGLVDKRYHHTKSTFRSGGASYITPEQIAKCQASQPLKTATFAITGTGGEEEHIMVEGTSPPLLHHDRLSLPHTVEECNANMSIVNLRSSRNAQPRNCAMNALPSEIWIRPLFPAGDLGLKSSGAEMEPEQGQRFQFSSGEIAMCEGFDNLSLLAFPAPCRSKQNAVPASLFRLSPGESEYVKHSIACETHVETDMKISSVAETDVNSLWVASNKSQCRRIDYRTSTAATGAFALHYNVKRSSEIVQLTALSEFEMLALKNSGDLVYFDTRNITKTNMGKGEMKVCSNRSYCSRKNLISEMMQRNRKGAAAARKPRLFALNNRILLTYNSESSKRCGLVLSNKLELMNSTPIEFHMSANGDPSASQLSDGSLVLTETYFKQSIGKSVVRVWKENENTNQSDTWSHRFDSYTLPHDEHASGAINKMHSVCKGRMCLPVPEGGKDVFLSTMNV